MELKHVSSERVRRHAVTPSTVSGKTQNISGSYSGGGGGGASSEFCTRVDYCRVGGRLLHAT